VLIPFARNELQTEGRRRRAFNQQVSKGRIVVEWAFGRLKSWFPALTKLGAVRDMADIYRAIEAMMIVHNMCFQLGDAPGGFGAGPEEESESEPEVDLEVTQGDYNAAEGDLNVLGAGRAFRQQCVDILCPA
jgi:hypothetical protein